MTQEQIKNLAREYAESVTPIESYGDDIVERRMNGIIEYGTAISVLQWLSERYAIVDKSNLSQLVRHKGDGVFVDEDGFKHDCISYWMRVPDPMPKGGTA